VIPGYSDQRQAELLVESGLTPLEAIKVCTLNGATYLGRADRIGSIAVGKQADLVVIDGNPRPALPISGMSLWCSSRAWDMTLRS